MPAVFTLDGDEFKLGDLTLDECEAIEDELKLTWGEINPITSAKHARVVLGAFLARSKGADEARRIVGALTIEQFDAITTFEKADDDDGEDGDDPKAPEGPPDLSE